MGTKYLEEQDRLSRIHRLHPTVGDYWEEHFCPVMVVLDVSPTTVTICDKRKDAGPNHWTWDFDHVKTITREAFSKKPLYDKDGKGALGDKCYAHVHPGRQLDFVDAWRSLPTKIVTDTPHFSQRFLEVV